jgi:hypothetical protein
VILEDTLATNINADDPSQIDNNNYQARAISVLGTTPPDLQVSELVAPATVAIGASYSFSYRVENRGDAFNGSWTDSVYLADSADWQTASEVWHLADYAQTRSLGFGEGYSVSQTLQLAPWIKGSYLILRTDSGKPRRRGGRKQQRPRQLLRSSTPKPPTCASPRSKRAQA